MSTIYAVVGAVLVNFAILGAWAGVLWAWEEKKRTITWRQTLKEEREKKERENLEMAVKSIEQLMAGDQ